MGKEKALLVCLFVLQHKVSMFNISNVVRLLL